METKSPTVSHHRKAFAMDILAILVGIAVIPLQPLVEKLIANYQSDIKLGLMLSFYIGAGCLFSVLFRGARYHSDLSNRYLYGHEPISSLFTFGEAAWQGMSIWLVATSLFLFTPMLGKWAENTTPFNYYVAQVLLVVLFIIAVGFFVIGGVARNKRLDKKQP